MNGYIYVLTNKHNKVLYTGVTSDLKKRLVEHLEGSSRFTYKYKTNKLVYVEFYENIEDAIKREKKLKRFTRQQKLDMITSANERWENLTETLP